MDINVSATFIGLAAQSNPLIDFKTRRNTSHKYKYCVLDGMVWCEVESTSGCQMEIFHCVLFLKSIAL